MRFSKNSILREKPLSLLVAMVTSNRVPDARFFSSLRNGVLKLVRNTAVAEDGVQKPIAEHCITTSRDQLNIRAMKIPQRIISPNNSSIHRSLHQQTPSTGYAVRFARRREPRGGGRVERGPSLAPISTSWRAR